MIPLAPADAARLLEVARWSLEHAIVHGCAAEPDVAAEPPPLRAPGASFVTLRGPQQELRGCVGMLEPVRPLVSDVAENAFRAGFLDARFTPPRPDELPAFGIHISVLGPLARLDVGSEEELLAKLRPGIDGLVLRYRGRRGTFLPDVWTSLPDPRAWLEALMQKTGLPSGFWSEEIEVHRYTTFSIDEEAGSAYGVAPEERQRGSRREHVARGGDRGDGEVERHDDQHEGQRLHRNPS